MNDNQQDGTDPLHLAAELTMAWLGNHGTRAKAEEVPAFLRAVHETMLALRAGSRPAEPEQPQAPEEHTPAVTVRKSLASPDHIISMIDGKPYRMLKRHLATNGLTPDQYRERYGLKPDYPMVAPNYSANRSETAKRLGLGRKPAPELEDDQGEPIGEGLPAVEQNEAAEEGALTAERGAAPEAEPRRKLKLSMGS